MRILITTDAWFPQINGVVRTIDTTSRELERLGHEVRIISPAEFRTVPLPTYPEIRIALAPWRRMGRMIEDFGPDAIHVATEGPLGFAARGYCVRRRIAFTTAYHTRFPEYIRDRAPVPLALSYDIIRRFHAPASGVMVATASLERALRERGFRNILRWSRGVDTGLFRPRPKAFLDAPRPVMMYVGRVAVEKNIEDFLRLDLPGTKYVVGDGPQLAELKARYPQVRFVGARHGEDLARHYAAADVFVFPSRTDTFGLVLLEALASGVPVAAYPVCGPIDILGGSDVGVLDEDLAAAVTRALAIPPERCRAFALRHSWQASSAQFLDNLRRV
ncbi:MAG TPA: glycosyltransferase family 1 protein [Azospirillaceae bacterium]|nr:glycosyltransferase family 1 protein [Azospirillaceae bacterium]